MVTWGMLISLILRLALLYAASVLAGWCFVCLLTKMFCFMRSVMSYSWCAVFIASGGARILTQGGRMGILLGAPFMLTAEELRSPPNKCEFEGAARAYPKAGLGIVWYHSTSQWVTVVLTKNGILFNTNQHIRLTDTQSHEKTKHKNIHY